MNDPRETLNRIRRQVNAATDGPWAPWLDQDGTPHMNGLLMVGNAAAVIPEGESWVEGVDVNPIAHTYTPEDREFIAAARTTVPALLDALEKVLELHPRVVVMAADPEFGQMEDDAICGACIVNHEPADWPCPNVRAITTALDGIR